MYHQNNQCNLYNQSSPSSTSSYNPNYYSISSSNYNQYYNYYNWYNQQTNMYDYQGSPSSTSSSISSNDSILNNSVNYSNYSVYYPNINSSELSTNQSISSYGSPESSEISNLDFTNVQSFEVVQPKDFNNYKENKVTKSTYPRKQLLPDFAVDIMNDWFEDHINNPYPTLEDKEKMAKQGGITVKQVTAWFSNRRNRSQNTKPKRIKRAIEQEVNEMMSELVYNPNKFEIIEKFRRTLLNQ